MIIIIIIDLKNEIVKMSKVSRPSLCLLCIHNFKMTTLFVCFTHRIRRLSQTLTDEA